MNVGHTVYGLRLEGPAVGDLSAFLLPATPAGGPNIAVRRAGGRAPPGVSPYVDEAGALIDLPGGRWLELKRSTREATYGGPGLSPDQLAHPYFSPLAVIFNRWLGREVFHAGAFLTGDAAWAVVGPPEAGKSSFLAAIADGGMEVLADDLSVTDGERVFTGPRCLDLRQRLPVTNQPLTRARDNTRWRLLLSHGAPSHPLGGWLFLQWGDEPSLIPVPASKLLGKLARHRLRRQLPTDASILLALANRPAWVVTRPRSWEGVEATIASVVSTVATARRDSLVASS